MGLTYDGITYRSLEEQVRYDAEQVQLLKQADVTINENLQTVNTEISGKLTKPTNPSAESAVTMLADGTVGTKLLSEIGGGGKSYLHEIKGSYNDGESYIVIKIINTSNTEITDGDGTLFASIVQEGYPAYFRDITTRGVVSVSLEGGGIYKIMGVLNKTNNQTYYVNGSYRFQMFTDTVTEL